MSRARYQTSLRLKRVAELAAVDASEDDRSARLADFHRADERHRQLRVEMGFEAAGP